MTASRDPIQIISAEIDDLRYFEALVKNLEAGTPRADQLDLHALAISRATDTRDRLRAQPERADLTAKLLEIFKLIGGWPRFIEWLRAHPAEAAELGIEVPVEYVVTP